MVNLEMATTSKHDEGGDGAHGVDGEADLPVGLAEAPVVDDHSRLGEREPGEHADGVQRDEVGDVTAEHDDQCSGQGGEHEDPVGEDEPIAAVGELAGEEAVAGDDPGQAWKVGVGGVGRENQDGERGELEEEVHERLSSEHRSGHDREHGFATLLGYRLEVVCQHGGAEEQ